MEEKSRVEAVEIDRSVLSRLEKKAKSSSHVATVWSAHSAASEVLSRILCFTEDFLMYSVGLSFGSVHVAVRTPLPTQDTVLKTLEEIAALGVP